MAFVLLQRITYTHQCFLLAVDQRLEAVAGGGNQKRPVFYTGLYGCLAFFLLIDGILGELTEAVDRWLAEMGMAVPGSAEEKLVFLRNFQYFCPEE